jgi:hypothetical protein
VPGQYHGVQILELERVDDVGDVHVEVDRRTQ